MATTYELLSAASQPDSCAPVGISAMFGDSKLQSREYALPVQRNQRVRIERPKQSHRKTARAKDQASLEKPRSQSRALVTQRFPSSKTAGRSGKNSDTEDKEEEAEQDESVECFDDAKSIGSSALHSEPAEEVSHEGVDRVRAYYLRYCEKAGLVAMGIVLRQLGSSKLDLHFNNLGDVGLKSLAVPITTCPGLQHVNLSNANIGDSGVTHLMHALCDNEELRHLDLSHNKISSTGGESICQFIEQSKTIRTIIVSGNTLGDVFAKCLSEALQNSIGLLETLHASKCGLGEESGQCLGPALATNDTLTDVDLSWNSIRLAGAVAISNALKENDTLHTLNVSWNGFSLEGATALENALAQNHSLTHLDLSNNRLVDKSVLKIVKALRVNDGLQMLKLDMNPFQEETAILLLKAVLENDNSSLRHLEIQGVPVRKRFTDTLAELRAKCPDFQVTSAIHEETVTKKSAFDTLFEHLTETGKSIEQIFGLEEIKQGPIWINKTAFIQQVKEAETPLTEFQIIEIANIAERKDGSVVNIGYLFGRWQQYQGELKASF